MTPESPQGVAVSMTTEIGDVEKKAIASLQTHGWCVLSNIIPKTDLNDVRESVRTSVVEHSRQPAPRFGVSNLLRYDQSLLPHLGNPEVTTVVEAIVGPKWRISFATGYVTGPGTERDIWHADFPYNQRNAAHIPAPYPDVPMHLTTFWMLTDFTPENGATYVMPGSHRKPDHPRPGGQYGDWLNPLDGEARLLGSAGDVAILDSRLWHAVSPNQTNNERIAVVVRCAPWWLNLNPTRRDHIDRALVVGDGILSPVEDLPLSVYEAAPTQLRPRLAHLLPQGTRGDSIAGERGSM